MTKADFLTQLDRRLQILKEHEREDILGEYSQHIELKMENGLSEEEAIRDFGDLEELAAEILDAYNVNPLYGKEEKSMALVMVNMEEIGEKAGAFGRKVTDGLKAGGLAVWHLMVVIGSMLKLWALDIWHLLGRMWKAAKHGFWVMVHWLPFGDRVVTEDGEVRKERQALFSSSRKEKEMQETEVRERRDKNVWNQMRCGGKAFTGWLWRVIVWCFRLGVLLFVVAPAAIGDCIALVLLGGLVVMVIQGYPLVGVTLMTFGALMCGVSFVWLVWSLLFGKKKEEGEKVWESEDI